MFTPLYTMVSFTRVPYADAVQKARRQDIVVAIVLSLVMVIIPAAIMARAGEMRMPQSLTLMATIVYTMVMILYARAVVRRRRREK